MADFSSRRLKAFNLRLVDRHPTDYAQNLQDAMEELWDQATRGIPAGFNETVPLTVLVGGTAAPGTEAAGWMAADAQLAVARGTPVAVGFANSAGTSTDAAAADHVHDATPATDLAGSLSLLLAWYL